MDRLCLLGLQAWEKDLHGPCGHPLTFTLDPDSRGHFVPHDVTCWACHVVESRAVAAAKQGRTPPPGQIVSVSPSEALRHAMANPLPGMGMAPTVEGG